MVRVLLTIPCIALESVRLVVREYGKVDHIWSSRTHGGLRLLPRYGLNNAHIHGGVDGGRCKPSPSHAWVSGIVLCHVLPGDPIVLECAMGHDRGPTKRLVAQIKERLTSAGQARSTGCGMPCHTSLHDLTGDRSHLDKGLILSRNRQRLKWKQKGPYHDGDLKCFYCTQGVCNLQGVTGDEQLKGMLYEGARGILGDGSREWPVSLGNVEAHVGGRLEDCGLLEKAQRRFAEYRPRSTCHTGTSLVLSSSTCQQA